MALNISPAGRRYGCHKDPSDHRDYGIAGASFMKASIPSVSNIALMGPVLDQGDQGSCTAHAAAADREYLHWKEIARRGGTVAPGSEGLYSPSFIYYLERETDDSLGQGDCGSYGRTSCATLRKYGCALRADMPYNPADFSTPPTDAQLAGAVKFSTGQYHRLGNVQDMKSCLASGYNFRIGFTVYESFEEDIGGDGVWSPRPKKEAILGGHEVLAIGYDDKVNGGSFQVRNSWGAGWGDAGNFWLRYSDAANTDILQDSWIQHLGIW